MITRREFLKLSAASAGALAAAKFKILRAFAFSQPTLPPGSIDQFVMQLVIPPAMPGKFRGRMDEYKIAVRQFQQQILPEDLPKTTVWSYGSSEHPDSFNYPAFTIEARYKRPVRIQWKNELVDGSGDFLPHLLPVDPTLHWANPPGGVDGRDKRPTFASTPGPYEGPVPIITHVHGAHTHEDSDGFPEAWYLPDANNIPADFARTGTYFDVFNQKYQHGWGPGAATFQYPNNQRATTLWYHDHTLGMTRLNVYAGPAGFYLLRQGPGDLPNGVLPGPAPGFGADPFGTYYEIPLAIQDRSFNDDGSLFYPDTREFFDGFAGPYIGASDSDISPIWNPEFFGNTMVVNGRTWPFLEVEQRRYRFRFLNGCNSRFLILKMSNDMPFYQIGAEGGFLPAPMQLSQLLMAPAERADVIVDFTNIPVNTEIVLLNLGPDEPFGGGEPGVDFTPADPTTTGRVMQFRVVPATSLDMSNDPARLTLPAFKPLRGAVNTRQVSLNEMMSMTTGFDGPAAALLGLVVAGAGEHKMWSEPITENPALGATEVWEMFNFTEDAHPIHIHLVQFQVVGREPIGGGTSIAGQNTPLPWETGFKDTVIAYPGEITRVKAKFDLKGLYVWHCHIVEHEDNEMMRPYAIGPMP